MRRDLNPDDWPTLPPPNGWVMGVALVGAGITLWWLTSGAVRAPERTSRRASIEARAGGRFRAGRREPRPRRWRGTGVAFIASGVLLIAVQVAHL